jgi:D-alanine transaminase
MPELAYLNGDIMPIEEARVPIEDRGYQFADAVYEYLAGYKGRLFALEQHLDRLEHSMRVLNFPTVSRDMVRNALVETLKQSGIEDAGVYLQISRGVAPRFHPFPANAKPQIVITVRQAPRTPPEHIQNGIRAITVADIRWGRCDVKTVQLLANVLAKQQALEAGVQDAIFISSEGIVREGTASNLFIRQAERLLTHPANHRILSGITRSVLIDICNEHGIEVREQFFDLKALLAAQEVFLTGTATEVLPVIEIDGRTIADGRPGEVTRKLRKYLVARGAEQTA